MRGDVPLRTYTGLYGLIRACTSLYAPLRAYTRLYAPIRAFTRLYIIRWGAPILFSLKNRKIDDM